MLTSSLCVMSMTSSLQDRIVTLSTRNGALSPSVDMQKKLLILAGVLSECLMDYENPFEELRQIDHDVHAQLSKGDDSSQYEVPVISMEDLDKTLEIGRSLARLYLDDDEQASRALRRVIMNILCHDLHYGPFDEAARRQQAAFFIKGVHHALSFEVVAHLFCDRVIDLKIAQDNWTISDALMAMAGLAGRFYAFAALQEHDELSEKASVFMQDMQAQDPYFQPEVMLQLISAETLRMGGMDGGDLLLGMAANDTQYRTCPHLVYSLEPCFAVLAERYELHDYALKSLAVAKATGRMIAIACSGQDAEMEHSVARPLTVSSLIGSVSHFAPV